MREDSNRGQKRKYRPGLKGQFHDIFDSGFFINPFATGINDTSGTITALNREYLREFSKKFEMTLMLFSGVLGMMIHKKNLKQKIS
jgi:hypothetical protein